MARSDIRRTPPRGRQPEPTQQPSSWRRIVRRVFVWGFALALLGTVALAVAVGITARTLPSYDELKSSQVGQMIVVRARDGSELFAMGPSYGKWVPYGQIPQVMKDAMLSTEDKRFRSHPGVDPVGIARSFYVRYQEGRFKQGGSTITQQLARTVFLNNDRTWSRKLREVVLALALEWNFSKDQILEAYLNKVYFGGGAYGIDAASRKFFGHPGTNLSLSEAAIIAGLVKAPSHYSPTADAKAAVDRAQVVLNLMVVNGAISRSEADAVEFGKMRFAAEKGQNSARYFTDWALPQLDLLLGDVTEPIEVWTTLDPKLQAQATSSIQANVPGGAQGALVSLDRDGAVLAMVGGTDYVTSNYNRATNAVRQPGSVWKLFVFLAALEAGYNPDSKVVDEPVTIQGWTPRNSTGTYAGEIDVRTAFAYSKNTVAAQLGNEVGFSAVAGMARRFGITTPISTYPSMVLGANEVRLIDMTRAFASVSAKGQAIEPYGIVKVTSTGGRVLYQREARGGQMLVPAYVAAGITDLLQSAVNIGTGRAAQIGRPVAGKTGTTTSNKDGWFLGFSSGVTTGVWMGRDDDKPVPGLQGGTAPARAFATYMKSAVANRPVEQFDTEITLPAWQLEPDDEANLGINPDEYYYPDEQGNMVEPLRPDDQEQLPPDQGVPNPNEEDAPPPAANQDFLDQATGRNRPQQQQQAPPARPQRDRAVQPQ
ncbi:penicillin-binding protein 1A [Novosphingobium kunmingense]|uniref:Penicillin-binding protein 1A n=1 Tax=Novosphingobium kunmingense TaxID=1211806 RepID=A0A2N0HKE8_9SPHN|nr:PBP1A family penicillin-binding protein [Novosphingobium kunmingense]PKB19348.1 penicillin-binding protein 1A [Novosphingobium kunmingense]